MVNVLIASPLASELVERIKAVDPRLNVIYRADLLGTPRYAGDHFPPVNRSPEQQEEWASLLAQAEIMLDVDQPSIPTFLARAHNIRWIQSSSSGIGEWVRRLGLAETPIVVTNAAGMHATPLAEFVVFAMLYFARHWPRMAAEQRAHHWERCAIDTLDGKTLGIIGLGQVGREVARLARPFGMRVIGMRRGRGNQITDVDRVYAPDQLGEVLSQSDYLALCVPHTPETVGMIGPLQLEAMKPTAVLINIARGSVIDEQALIQALQQGQLAGAALDVVAHEPLPPESPLWDLPNVLITPHSMSTATSENAWLTDLFCDNLRRYLNNQPLRNVFNKQRGY